MEFHFSGKSIVFHLAEREISNSDCDFKCCHHCFVTLGNKSFSVYRLKSLLCPFDGIASGMNPTANCFTLSGMFQRFYVYFMGEENESYFFFCCASNVYFPCDKEKHELFELNTQKYIYIWTLKFTEQFHSSIQGTCFSSFLIRSYIFPYSRIHITHT